MRVAVWIILIAVFGVPFLGVLWFLFPLFAGSAAVVLLAGRGPKGLRKVLTPLLSVFLAVFVIWLFVKPFKHPPLTPVEKSLIARTLTGTPETRPAPANDDTAEVRRALDRQLAVARFEIQKVGSALDTLRSAQSVFTSLSIKAQPDRAGLGSALEDLRTALASAKLPDGTAVNLLEPGVLAGVVKSLASDIQTIESQSGPSLTKDELIAQEDLLPGLLNRRGVAPLPTKLVRLENAVRETLNAKLDAETTFVARFNRDQDEVTYEQETTLRFNGSLPKSVDLSNFFSGTARNDQETVTFQQNGGAPAGVLSSDTLKTLAVDANFVVARRSIAHFKASQPILNGHYFLSFREIDIHWPTSAFPTIVANIRLPENPDDTWPWTVDTGSGADFRGVEIPRYSYIFSTPEATMADQKNSSLLSFDEKVTPQNLATNSSVTIEFLPWWLSLDEIQQHKQFLITENAAFALIAAALSGFLTFLIELATPRKKGKGLA
jgi:hypothetical protein